jgi:hypothetical protein
MPVRACFRRSAPAAARTPPRSLRPRMDRSQSAGRARRLAPERAGRSASRPSQRRPDPVPVSRAARQRDRTRVSKDHASRRCPSSRRRPEPPAPLPGRVQAQRQPCLRPVRLVLEPPGQAWRVPRAGQASRNPAIRRAPAAEVQQEPAPWQAAAGEAAEPDPVRVPLPGEWIVSRACPVEAEPLGPGLVSALLEMAQGLRSGRELVGS